jgi:ankyrin repeat protein
MDIKEELQQAIQSGDAAKLKSLVESHAELVNAPLANGVSPLMLATYYGRTELAGILVQHGAEQDIYVAAARGNVARVRELLDAHPDLLNSFAPDGHIPLGLAAFFGQRAVVQLLLERGAKVNVSSRNPQKVMPLHGAVSRGDIEITRLLLDKGAEVNARQERGFTPLFSAAGAGNMPLVEFLVKHGADVNARADDGKTAHDIALERKQDKAAEWLKVRMAQSAHS